MSEITPEPKPEPGYIARTRKASMAAAVALTGTLSTAVLAVTADGIVTSEECIAYGIISLGIGAAAWFATWSVPNAS